MEKVICTHCGSIGYTASPGHVPCSKCGGKHKVVRAESGDVRSLKRGRILSAMLGLAKG